MYEFRIPLSLAPQDAIRLLALNRHGSLEVAPPITGPGEKERSAALRFYLNSFDPGHQTPTSPGRAELQIMSNDEELLAPSPAEPEVFERQFWIRTGQFIETRSWLLKVTRIVFPDHDQGTDGWVEIRVEPNRPLENRPPAPFLPED